MRKKITICVETQHAHETITMKLPEGVVGRLKKSALDGSLESELTRLCNNYKLGCKTEVTRPQYYSLRDFCQLINNKSCDFTLSLV